jgi:hypothetical protein
MVMRISLWPSRDLDGLRVRPGGNQQAGAGVPEVVEPEPVLRRRQRRAHRGLEVAPVEQLVSQRASLRPGEHERVRPGAAGGAGEVLGEQLAQELRQRDGPLGLRRLD